MDYKVNTKLNLRINKNLGIILISILTSSIYFQTTNFKYTLDDQIYTYNNSVTIKGLNGITDIFSYGSLNFFTLSPSNSGTYRPFALLSFAIEYELFDSFNPSISHLINVLLYLLLIILLGYLLFILFDKKKINSVLSLLILLIFAIHPLHIEVVSSVKSRDALMAATFLIASFLIRIKSEEGKNKSFFWISILCYFCALLSKEDSITFIAVYFITFFYFFKVTFIKSLLKTLPFIFTALIYLIIRFSVLEQTITEGASSILNNIIYATQGIERFATNLYVWINYLKLTFYPFPLSYDYSYNQISAVNFTNIWPIISLLIFTLLIGIAIRSLKSRNVFGFGIWFYLITFSIYSNLFTGLTIGSTLAERFLFMPILGLITSFIILLDLIVSKAKSDENKIIVMFIVGIIASVFVIKDLTHVKVWKNKMSLYKSGIITSPNSWRTHAFYASVLKQEAQNILINGQSNGNNERANQYLTKAIEEYKKSIEIIETSKVRILENYLELGACYIATKDTINAMKSFQNALRVNPKSIQALYNIFMISINQNNYNLAINYGLKLLELYPGNVDNIMQNMAKSYANLKDYENAIKMLERSLRYSSNQEKLTILLALHSLINDSLGMAHYQQLIAESSK